MRTALNGNDEGRRRAAAALLATEEPRPGGKRVRALYEAHVMATTVLDAAATLVQNGPNIP
jgi:hypothetical protein